jgi:hypothetical protein
MPPYCVCGIEFILTCTLRRPPLSFHRGSTAMVEGRFRLPGGAGCCLQTDIENVAPFRVKIVIFLQYLVLVLMRGSEF